MLKTTTLVLLFMLVLFGMEVRAQQRDSVDWSAGGEFRKRITGTPPQKPIGCSISALR